MADLKETHVQKARLAGKEQRFGDMLVAMTEVAKAGQPLTAEERNLLQYAFEKVVDKRRCSLKEMSSTAQECDMTEAQAKACQEEVEKELMDTCKSALNLLEEHLIPSANDQNNPESLVLYLKMSGDYCRYLAEIATGPRRDELVKNAASNYASAKPVADKRLQPTHPVRLGLYLNYSVFMYEIQDKESEAQLLANEAVERATNEANWGSLPEEWRDEARSRLQLLRKYICEWTTESDK